MKTEFSGDPYNRPAPIDAIEFESVEVSDEVRTAIVLQEKRDCYSLLPVLLRRQAE